MLNLMNPDAVAVSVKLLGGFRSPDHGGTVAIICLECAHSPVEVLGEYTKERLDGLDKNYACELCGVIIGTFRPEPEMVSFSEYKALARQLATMHGEDLINLIGTALRQRPDCTPIPNAAESVSQYDLKYTTEVNDHEGSGLPLSMDLDRHFVVTINDKTVLPDPNRVELARVIDDTELLGYDSYLD